jgi:PAS domain S-box-containing protein/putative nucleotidyltransferase with HDIG domain
LSDVNTHHFPHRDILVIDDNTSDLKYLSSILREAGHTVRPASDGELALRSVQARLPGLVLLDIEMPGLDGYEVCRRLKAAEESRDIPVIFISVKTSPLDKVKAFGVGGVDYISKPFDPQEVLAHVATHLALWKAQKEVEEKNLQLQQEITERKRAEEALAAERQRLFDVLETLPAMICLLTPDYHVAFANRSFRNQFGESRGRHCYEYCFGLTEPCKFCEAYEVLKTGQPHRWEVVTPDGNVIDVYDFPFTDIDGSPLILEMDIDITERKRAEEALRESEETLRTIFAASPDCVYVSDTEGRVLDANPTLLELVGLSLEQMQERNVLDFFAGDDPSELLQAASKLQAGEEVRGLEAKAKLVTGEIRDYEVHAIPLMRERRVVTAILNVARDITERKRAEEALRESERFLKNVFDAIQNGISVLDRDLTVVQTNRWIEKMYAAHAPLVGKKCYAVYQERSSPCPWCPSLPALETGEQHIEIVPYPSVEEPTGWIELTAFPLKDDSSQTLGVIEHVKDITERKRAEEELRQSYLKLQKALQGTVHALGSAVELRDPYTAGHQRQVTQLACAIAREMGLPEEQIEGLRMAALIHDIGKISIPAEILSNPNPLTGFQWSLIKAHAQIGHDILKDLDFPWPLADIVLQHHERLDGSGYPEGLSGAEIIQEARILAVADVVEAMASHRPYRPAHSMDEALEEISQNRGILYNSEVVDTCLKLFTEKGFKFK